MEGKFDIAIGIPSLNEALTISNVAKQIDRGLTRHFPGLKSIIVNVDNNSTDGTKDIFISTKTKTPKQYISTEEGIIGKGLNLKNFFDLAATYRVRAGAVFDADLESIAPEWIKQIISPLLEGYDFIFPVYTRYKYDGAITSQLCYPLVTGIFGSNIRQPIGGDFGFSRLFLQDLAVSPLPVQARAFGIDIYLTTRALIDGFKCCGVALGRKIHFKRDRATLGPMLQDVTDSIFFQIKTSGYHMKKISITSPTVFNPTSKIEVCPPVPVNTDAIENLFFSGFPEYMPVYRQSFSQDIFNPLLSMFERSEPILINREMWCDIVYSLLNQYLSDEKNESGIADSITPLFFARLISFIEETKERDQQGVEDYVRNQAEFFFSRREMVNK